MSGDYLFSITGFTREYLLLVILGFSLVVVCIACLTIITCCPRIDDIQSGQGTTASMTLRTGIRLETFNRSEEQSSAQTTDVQPRSFLSSIARLREVYYNEPETSV